MDFNAVMFIGSAAIVGGVLGWFIVDILSRIDALETRTDTLSDRCAHLQSTVNPNPEYNWIPALTGRWEIEPSPVVDPSEDCEEDEEENTTDVVLSECADQVEETDDNIHAYWFSKDGNSFVVLDWLNSRVMMVDRDSGITKVFGTSKD